MTKVRTNVKKHATGTSNLSDLFEQTIDAETQKAIELKIDWGLNSDTELFTFTLAYTTRAHKQTVHSKVGDVSFHPKRKGTRHKSSDRMRNRQIVKLIYTSSLIGFSIVSRLKRFSSIDIKGLDNGMNAFTNIVQRYHCHCHCHLASLSICCRMSN